VVEYIASQEKETQMTGAEHYQETREEDASRGKKEGQKARHQVRRRRGAITARLGVVSLEIGERGGDEKSFCSSAKKSFHIQSSSQHCSI